MLSDQVLRAAIEASKLYIVCHDFGSADPDDILAGLLWIQALENDPEMCVLIVATHFRAPKRAMMASKILIHSRLEIRAVPEMSENQFKQVNPLWPTKIFGDPFNNPGERVWFADFGKAFEHLPQGEWYPLKERLSEIFILCKAANKNTFCGKICLCSPLEALDWIPSGYDSCFVWVAMGGCQANGTSGYNWGLSPDALERFQTRMLSTNRLVYCVTSEMAERCCLSKDHFDSWCAIAEKSAPNSKQRALIDECRRCFSANALNAQKKMADPIAVYLALSIVTTPIAGSRGMYTMDVGSTYLDSKMNWHFNLNGPICIPQLNWTLITENILEQLDTAFRNLT